MEEDDLETARPETGLTEVRIQIEGKEIKTLVDTGSEISVISEHILEGLQETNKNIPILPTLRYFCVSSSKPEPNVITLFVIHYLVY